MVSSDRSDERLDERIVAATLRCVARWGIAKTTLDDVAREAGCGRATIYRTFAGGKGAVLRAVLAREITRCAEAVDLAVGSATSLEEVLVEGAVAASRFLREHEALAFLLAHEPDAVLPHIAFDRLDRLFAGGAYVTARHLARFLPADEVAGASEWVTRVVLSYALSPTEGIDLADRAEAERFVRTYLLPSIVPIPRAETSRS